MVTYKRACYLKPVVASRVAPLTVDKFGGLQLSWSRFGGSLRSTMEWIDQSTVWEWAADLQAVADYLPSPSDAFAVVFGLFG